MNIEYRSNSAKKDLSPNPSPLREGKHSVHVMINKPLLSFRSACPDLSGKLARINDEPGKTFFIKTTRNISFSFLTQILSVALGRFLLNDNGGISVVRSSMYSLKELWCGEPACRQAGARKAGLPPAGRVRYFAASGRSRERNVFLRRQGLCSLESPFEGGRGMTRKVASLVLLFLFIGIFSSHAQLKHRFTHEDTLRGCMNPNRLYDVTYYDLNINMGLEMNMQFKYINGTNTIYFKALANLDSIQVDLDTNMKVGAKDVNIVLNEDYVLTRDRIIKELTFGRQGKCLYIRFPHTVKKDSVMAISIDYNGRPREAINPPWDGGFVWRFDKDSNYWVGTACEGIGASTWWPCKDFLGDEPDSMRITCTVPDGYFCKSNGRMFSNKTLVVDMQFDPVNDPEYIVPLKMQQSIWKVDYPINTYDVTLNIGKYVDIKDSFYSDAGKIDLHFYPLEENRAEAHAYFPTRTKQMLKCFEHYFGPYPFTKDGYSLVETYYWGMEHQSAIAYGNHFKDSTLGYKFDFILIHESAHEWWGNSLSCADEAEMWLHESFATYAEALYVEYYWGKDSYTDYLLKQKHNIVNAEPVIGPMGVNYDRKDNDIYYKGSWMLHTLRSVINNDDLFFKIIYTFATQYHCSIVHTSDFVNLVNKMTGKDYTAFFDEYLRQTKLPELKYTIKKHRDKVSFTYQWENAINNFSMPMDIMIDGNAVTITVTTEKQSIVLPYVSDKNYFGEDRYLFDMK